MRERIEGMLDYRGVLTDFDPPKTVNHIELSIVIPCRSESWPVLAMSLQSVQEEAIAATGQSWECIVVFNSAKDDPNEGEERFKTSNYRRFGNFRYAAINVQSAWQARNAGLYLATGKYTWIGDSHLILGRDLFSKLLKTFEEVKSAGINLGILHSALGWLSGVHQRDLVDCYIPRIKIKFWGDWSKDRIVEPHPICMKGTSFMLETEVAKDYLHWNKHFKAYGGGEPYINLKAWRLGYEVWVDPSAYVWHLAYKRNYSWNSAEFWFNTLLAAYTIGGDKWLKNQTENYERLLKERHTGHIFNTYMNSLFKLREEVIEVGNDDMELINKRSVYTLDDLMEKYKWE